MRLTYRGTRDNNKVGYACAGRRFAEITYYDSEQTKFEYVVQQLRNSGWHIDDSVEFWACVEVADKEEFNALKDDWEYWKKHI